MAEEKRALRGGLGFKGGDTLLKSPLSGFGDEAPKY